MESADLGGFVIFLHNGVGLCTWAVDSWRQISFFLLLLSLAFAFLFCVLRLLLLLLACCVAAIILTVDYSTNHHDVHSSCFDHLC